MDWEFTYAAPAEFSYAPPRWLLIESPEFWPKGIEDWTTVFGYRLKTFLKAIGWLPLICLVSCGLSSWWEGGKKYRGHFLSSYGIGVFLTCIQTEFKYRNFPLFFFFFWKSCFCLLVGIGYGSVPRLHVQAL